MSFVHLHLHTQYSLLDGANKLTELLPKVAKAGMPACAMTDHGNMFGAVQFHDLAKKHGVKPIIGCEIYVAPQSRHEKGVSSGSEDHETGGNYHLILLAMNRLGYQNLSRLVSLGYLEGLHRGKPRVDKDVLRELNGGLIALSGCLSGEVARNIAHDRLEKAQSAAEEFARLFDGRYYFEIQDNHIPIQNKVNVELKRMARELGLPLVATNDCHYLHAEDAHAHEALLCIQTGKSLDDPKRWKFDTDQLYVKTPDEMARAFADVPEAVRNTVAIADRVDFEFKQKYVFPVYTVPEETTLDDELARLAREGLDARLNVRRTLDWDTQQERTYDERLTRELGVIKDMGFAGYFLIVQDFINWAKSHGIPVGPGRGSAAGSLVGWALRITDLDPIEHALLFERFLNPERKSMPDIDVDFCFVRRDEVIRYVKEKYGTDRVAQIATFGTLKGKAAIKDVGRVLGFNFAETDRMAKLYPEAKQGKDFPLAKALEMEPRLEAIRTTSAREEKLFELALRLEGLFRHASKHAAGIVISPSPLTEDVPLFVDKDGAVITQFTFNDIDAIGLIKFDFLGLKTLTLIADIVRRIHERGTVTIDLDNLPLDDPLAYKLVSAGDTIGVFQLESGGMRRMLTALKPSCFADLVATLALYRPGPLDQKLEDGRTMVDVYIDRKHGRERVSYATPVLETILKETYGVIVYQEQVMQIAQALGGYSLGDADNLRRAMGKKKAEEMAKERKRFLAGAKTAALCDERTAGEIFDQMEKFAAYGFNKSHSAAYAVITYQTAYLKAHYPLEFLAGLLSLEAGDADATYKNFAECRDRNIRILPPDVNESREDFTVSGKGIRFGLGAAKGIGGKAIEATIVAREESGPYTSLHDYCLRGRSQQINRRVIEALIKCGAFDSLHRNRAQLLGGLDDAMKWATQRVEEKASPQMGLFAAAGKAAETPPPPLPLIDPWASDDELNYERETIGFFTSGHPLDRYEHDLRKFTTGTTVSVRNRRTERTVVDRNGREVRPKVKLGGVIHTVKLRNSKKGDRYATFALEDREGIIEVIVWPEPYRRLETQIRNGAVVVVGGGLDIGDDRCQVIADEMVPLADARADAIRQAHVTVPPDFGSDGLRRLHEVLTAHPGPCETFLHLLGRDQTETILALPPTIKIAASDAVVRAVETMLGSGMVAFR